MRSAASVRNRVLFVQVHKCTLNLSLPAQILRGCCQQPLCDVKRPCCTLDGVGSSRDATDPTSRFGFYLPVLAIHLSASAALVVDCAGRYHKVILNLPSRFQSSVPQAQYRFRGANLDK